MNTGFKTLACVAASLVVGGTAQAAIVYDNSASPSDPLTRSSASSLGDQVTLAGTDRVLTSWAFEYYATPGAGVFAQARILELDGDGNPSGDLYNSGAIALNDGYGTFVAEGLSLIVPDSFVWSVTFTGGDGDDGGLLFYDGPEVGASGDFYWVNDATDGWVMVQTDGLSDNFAARFTAVPEPGTWALLGGGLALLGFMSRRRKA